jgi:hypothetical protein
MKTVPGGDCMKKVFVVAMLVVLLITSACSQIPPAAQATITPAVAAVELPQELIDTIAENLNVGAEEIVINSAVRIDYPNSCLGLPSAEETCIEGIVPGFQGILSVGSAQFEFRSNDTGSRLRMVPIALKAARADLSKTMQIDIDSVRWVEAERVEWPDSCLGLEQPGLTCAEVITPGFRIILEAAGTLFIYRANESGSVVILEKFSN